MVHNSCLFNFSMSIDFKDLCLIPSQCLFLRPWVAHYLLTPYKDVLCHCSLPWLFLYLFLACTISVLNRNCPFPLTLILFALLPPCQHRLVWSFSSLWQLIFIMARCITQHNQQTCCVVPPPPFPRPFMNTELYKRPSLPKTLMVNLSSENWALTYLGFFKNF